VRFAEMTSPELDDFIRHDPVVLLPVGTMEEHGPHLPLETDAIIATEVAKRIDETMVNELPLLVMPTVWTGYSSRDVARWPGTMRLKPETVVDIVYQVCASLVNMGVKNIVVIHTHGHHAGIMRMVARKVFDELDVHIAITSPAAFGAAAFNRVRRSNQGSSVHAGEYETSLMMALGRRVVEQMMDSQDAVEYRSRFVSGDNFVSSEVKVDFWSTWGLNESNTGVLGDPTQACVETGQAVLKAILANYREFLLEFASVQKARRQESSKGE